MQGSKVVTQGEFTDDRHEDTKGISGGLEYKKIFNAVSEMIIIQDAETGQIIDVNNETVERTGYSREELIKQGVACFSPVSEEYSPDRAMQYIDKAAQGEPQLFEWGYVDKSGDFHPTEVSLKLTVFSGKPYLLATARDVSARKLAEEKIHLKSRELQRSNTELERFAYVASHDLQEPLRMIQSFSGLLKKHCFEELDEDGRSYLGIMEDAASRMRALLNDLLTFSRVTTRERAFEPVDLSRTAREVRANLMLRIEEAGGRIDIGELPTIDADPLQMRQLLQNLVSNALKFRQPDCPPEIKVSAREDGDLVHLSVEDNGIGLDEKFTDRIFVMFQRLHTRDEYEGTGVGLAICKKIVERHGGLITVSSSPGQGATFVASMPPVQRHLADEP